ncbi:MAG: hypothetical protein IPI67_12770 [Myxococcales bacterium]|nr:hypothetical protein [Myxococcales bacterium]
MSNGLTPSIGFRSSSSSATAEPTMTRKTASHVFAVFGDRFSSWILLPSSARQLSMCWRLSSFKGRAPKRGMRWCSKVEPHFCRPWALLISAVMIFRSSKDTA